MKTPTAVTELQAQIQQGELGGFTWMTRHLQLFDTFFVLMEKDDLEPFHDSSCRIFLRFVSFGNDKVCRTKVWYEQKIVKFQYTSYFRLSIQRNFSLKNPIK